MTQYLRHKENKELYLVERMCQMKCGATWEKGMVYRKLMANEHAQDSYFCRSENDIAERFTVLQTLACEHDLVSFDLVFDPKFPIERATSRSIGLDVRTTEAFTLVPGERRKVPTGVSWNVRSVDPEYRAELQGRPRSGHADKKGLSMVNCVGTIDEDYRGEIHAILINLGLECIEMKAGEKVAQLILGLSPNCDGLDEITNERERGTGGFGSTDELTETQRIELAIVSEAEQMVKTKVLFGGKPS
jgi:dUTP pyrophosphatase